MRRILFGIGLLILTANSFAQKIENLKELPDLVREAKQKKDFIHADSMAQDYINNCLFKLKRSELMEKDYLTFISQNMVNTDSKGFKFFKKEGDKVNEILGPNKAEYAMRYAIAKQFIPSETEWGIVKPNWDLLEKTIVSKFGALGREALYGRRMWYCFSIKDWTNFGKYYQLYFETALKRPEWIVNDLSFNLFLNVNDPKILNFACNVVMRYAMEEWYQMDAAAYDTYANLLYKTGKKGEAIEWEEKAVKLSNNNTEIVENLKKMRNNQATW